MRKQDGTAIINQENKEEEEEEEEEEAETADCRARKREQGH